MPRPVRNHLIRNTVSGGMYLYIRQLRGVAILLEALNGQPRAA